MDYIGLLIFLIGVSFSAGVIITVIKHDLKFIKNQISEKPSKAYMEKELTKLHKRIENIEKKVNEHEEILNVG